MPTDIKLDDASLTLESPVTRATGDLQVDKGLYLGKLAVTMGAAPQYALHELIPQFLARIEQLEQQLAAHHAIRDWSVQPAWRWCEKCQGLFHGGDGRTGGVCPVDARPHTGTSSSNYYLPINRTRHGGQAGWRWCDRCQGLFFSLNASAGRCPAGGEHSRSSPSSAYFVVTENSARDFIGQHEWRWCKKCEGLFFGPQTPASRCPAGDKHDGSGSSDYILDSR